MFPLVILIAASASPTADEAFRLQAARCGLKADQVVWTKDAEGHVRADLRANGDLDGLSFKSMSCLLDWAAKSGARVGFVSEPAPVSQQGSASRTNVALDDPATGLTLSGSSMGVDALLRAAEAQPHRWAVEKRWSKQDGSLAIRVKWPERPGPLDVGSIVWLTQAAQANGLAITETSIVEVQP